MIGRLGMLAATAACASIAQGCSIASCATAEVESDAGRGGAAGAAAAGHGSSEGGATAERCPGTGGPAMVRLPEGYCVDTTEVTRGDYEAWLANGAPSSASIEDCAWNASFTPDAICMSRLSVCQGSGCEDYPQVCVDWCDAYAYCQAVGKRLCGSIGGGPSASDAAADANQSQWYNACSSHGANDFPYGSPAQGACNGINNPLATFTVPVGSMRSCQTKGAYGGVFDLSGNVWEWEDCCAGSGAQGQCLRRGGSYTCESVYLTCDYGYEGARDEADEDVGFRCCSP